MKIWQHYLHFLCTYTLVIVMQQLEGVGDIIRLQRSGFSREKGELCPQRVLRAPVADHGDRGWNTIVVSFLRGLEPFADNRWICGQHDNIKPPVEVGLQVAVFILLRH